MCEAVWRFAECGRGVYSLALVLHAGGTVVPVDPALYPPIDQTAGILAGSEHPAARKFWRFFFAGQVERCSTTGTAWLQNA
jgi:hypothetical protein